MDKVLVLDFGGQYNQLIARRVRNLGVYAEIKSFEKISIKEILAIGYKAIIFTGGPNSVYENGAPVFNKTVLSIGIPVLGICYGAQLIAYLLGGKVEKAKSGSEYGKTLVKLNTKNPLFLNLPEKSNCFMSHTDYIATLPFGFKSIAQTKNCPIAAMCDEKNKIYAVQFHPEVTHTIYGNQIISNFLFEICGLSKSWQMQEFIDTAVEKYRKQLKDKKVLLALSGGVDSSVVAVLLSKAIGKNLTCVFVDHGLLRKGEGDFVEKTFGKSFGINLIRINAEERFLQKLKGVLEPERKRKIIGEQFIRVFEEISKTLGKIDVLAQGTIYPDVIESGKGNSAVIKSHHNVGGLPKVMGFDEIIEPLRELFKDEVREVGNKLGIPKELVYRQPFPGPGLAVRVIGEVTKDKLDILREADAIFREEIEKSKVDCLTNQYFAVLLNTRSVGVMGDDRTYGYTLALRAVTTDDFMTAEWTRLPFEVIEKVSSRITNEVKGISRVVYDVTNKPPATVEWE